MLSELHVENLGVIEAASITFGPGMTAVTGETGAGKTLLVEALCLVLGSKPDVDMVRSGAREALIEARFVVTRALLKTDSIPIEDQKDEFETLDLDQEVIVTRAVPRSGRSRAFRNGRMFSQSNLVDLGKQLLDIYGQHEHQSLLNQSAQRSALDEFAGIDPNPRKDARARLASINRSIDELGGDPSERARQVDILRFQIKEIEDAAISSNEEEENLREEVERLGNLGILREAGGKVLGLLDTDPTGQLSRQTVASLLGLAMKEISGISELAQMRERLDELSLDLGGLTGELRKVLEASEDDPQRLSDLQLRLRLLGDLRHKYGATLSEVLAFGQSCRLRLEEMLGAFERSRLLANDREESIQDLEREETKLENSRIAASNKLADAVSLRLEELNMAGARFSVEVDTGGGGDSVTFFLGANVGEAELPLAKVASGGELARSMLALRLVAVGGPPTLVFDEVDAGVGGEAALSLAKSLSELARDHQVLVVTHLAQVAAYADQHICVEKSTKEGRTTTEVVSLGYKERITELSRMMSGHPESPAAQRHAEELLACAGQAGSPRIQPLLD